MFICISVYLYGLGAVSYTHLVDAGGKGYVFILEATLAVLRGEAYVPEEQPEAAEEAPAEVKEKADFNDFSTGEIAYAYCTCLLYTSRKPDLGSGCITGFAYQLAGGALETALQITSAFASREQAQRAGDNADAARGKLQGHLRRIHDAGHQQQHAQYKQQHPVYPCLLYTSRCV